MRDGDGDGPGGFVLPGAPDAVDDLALDTPNCPDCLMRMEPQSSSKGEAYWACTECGFVTIA